MQIAKLKLWDSSHSQVLTLSGKCQNCRKHNVDYVTNEGLIVWVPEHQPIIFTDGSALGNSGACGAAAVCYLSSLQDQPIIISTSYHGELYAI